MWCLAKISVIFVISFTKWCLMLVQHHILQWTFTGCTLSKTFTGYSLNNTQWTLRQCGISGYYYSEHLQGVSEYSWSIEWTLEGCRMNTHKLLFSKLLQGIQWTLTWSHPTHTHTPCTHAHTHTHVCTHTRTHTHSDIRNNCTAFIDVCHKHVKLHWMIQAVYIYFKKKK